MFLKTRTIVGIIKWLLDAVCNQAIEKLVKKRKLKINISNNSTLEIKNLINENGHQLFLKNLTLFSLFTTFVWFCIFFLEIS